jgi:hypothetical protein
LLEFNVNCVLHVQNLAGVGKKVVGDEREEGYGEEE